MLIADSTAVVLHLMTVGMILTFKLAVLIVGYLIAKLGYDLLLKGVTGEFTFKTTLVGSKADLVSASPGIFFILLAVMMMCVAIWKDKPFSTTVSGSATSGTEPESPPALPDVPPGTTTLQN